MKPAQIAQIVFILAASVGVFAFVRAAQTDHRLSTCQALCQLRPTYAAHERRVPDFTLPDAQGRSVTFSSFLGKKPVVLNFWTKTCKPCLEEMPALQELAGIVKSEGIEVVTICTDEGPEAVADTLKVVLEGQEPAFTILYDPESTVVSDRFGTELFPETWLIDAKGVIRARIDGPKNWSSAIALEVLESLDRPLSCPVEFKMGRPVGDYRGLCGDTT
ncbi:MAG: TlpA disulfide reductase family protein [Polyangiaceae bacterium]